MYEKQYKIRNRLIAWLITAPLVSDNCIKFYKNYCTSILLCHDEQGTLVIDIAHSHRTPQWHDVLRMYFVLLSMRFSKYWLEQYRTKHDNAHHNNSHLFGTHHCCKSSVSPSPHHIEDKESATTTAQARQTSCESSQK